MRSPSSQPRAGGFILALGACLGAAIGRWQQQASAGLLLGLAAGGGVALLIWLLDRRR
jgi:hypothetical protein